MISLWALYIPLYDGSKFLEVYHIVQDLSSLDPHISNFQRIVYTEFQVQWKRPVRWQVVILTLRYFDIRRINERRTGAVFVQFG